MYEYFTHSNVRNENLKSILNSSQKNGWEIFDVISVKGDIGSTFTVITRKLKK